MEENDFQEKEVNNESTEQLESEKEVEVEELEAEAPVVLDSETESEEVVSVATQQETYLDIPTKTLGENESEIKPKWNWGAFSLSLWFAIAHRAYLGLLILLAIIPYIGPFFALVWAIIFGFHGEKWALESKENHYRDEEEFRKIMDGWNRAGLIAFIIGSVVFVLLLIFIVFILTSIFNHWNFFQDQFNQNYRRSW